MDASSRSEGKIHSFGSETRRFFYLHSNAFPLSLAIPPSRSLSGSPRLSSGLSALKLRLCPVHLETRHYVIYSSNIVLIDPLASLAAVEEFLWPRLHQRSESGMKPAAMLVFHHHPRQLQLPPLVVILLDLDHRLTPQRTNLCMRKKGTSLSKVKGKGVMKPAQADKGPQTRSSAQRKAALDKHTHMKPPGGDSSSDDEELDISPVDIDDAMVIEEEDISDDDDDEDDDNVDWSCSHKGI